MKQCITVTAAKINQTVTFGTLPVVTVGRSGTLSTTACSSLAVTFAWITTSICTETGSTARHSHFISVRQSFHLREKGWN